MGCGGVDFVYEGDLGGFFGGVGLVDVELVDLDCDGDVGVMEVEEGGVEGGGYL